MKKVLFLLLFAAICTGSTSSKALSKGFVITDSSTSTYNSTVNSTSNTKVGIEKTKTMQAFSTVAYLPVGTVIAFPSNSLPTGIDKKKWLICNGQEFSATDYPELKKVLGGNKVPNYNGADNKGEEEEVRGRGRFLRGKTLKEEKNWKNETITINHKPINDTIRDHIVYIPGHTHEFYGNVTDDTADGTADSQQFSFSMQENYVGTKQVYVKEKKDFEMNVEAAYDMVFMTNGTMTNESDKITAVLDGDIHPMDLATLAYKAYDSSVKGHEVGTDYYSNSFKSGIKNYSQKNIYRTGGKDTSDDGLEQSEWVSRGEVVPADEEIFIGRTYGQSVVQKGSGYTTDMKLKKTTKDVEVFDGLTDSEQTWNKPSECENVCTTVFYYNLRPNALDIHDTNLEDFLNESEDNVIFESTACDKYLLKEYTETAPEIKSFTPPTIPTKPTMWLAYEERRYKKELEKFDYDFEAYVKNVNDNIDKYIAYMSKRNSAFDDANTEYGSCITNLIINNQKYIQNSISKSVEDSVPFGYKYSLCMAYTCKSSTTTVSKNLKTRKYTTETVDAYTTAPADATGTIEGDTGNIGVQGKIDSKTESITDKGGTFNVKGVNNSGSSVSLTPKNYKNVVQEKNSKMYGYYQGGNKYDEEKGKNEKKTETAPRHATVVYFIRAER